MLDQDENMKFYRSAVLLVHSMWATRLRKGDIAIDCTCGHGFDALELGKCVLDVPNKMGWLHCIDIQSEAIESTKNTLLNAGFSERVSYHHQSHATFPPEIVANSVAGAVYNLGYLPRGNKQIISKPATTIDSINAVSQLVKPGGFISVLAYRGHEGGQLEYDLLCEMLRGSLFCGSQWSVDYMPSSEKSNSPVLIFMEKNS